MNNNHLGKDKWLHRAVCALLAFIVCGIATSLGMCPSWSITLTAIVVLIVGVGKEVYDSRDGLFDPYDLLADLEGCIVGIVFGLLTGLN